MGAHSCRLLTLGIWELSHAAAPTKNGCWIDGFSYDFCCSAERYGPTGNAECWGRGSVRGEVFSHERCCRAACNQPPRCWKYDDWPPELLERLSAWRVSSQGPQDAVLSLLFSLLGTTNLFFVEVGGPVGQSNTGFLASTHWHGCVGQASRWSGLTFDAEDHDPSNSIYREEVTLDNAIEIFDRYGVVREPDLLSIDIDSCDLWVFLALTRAYRPRVVAIEYNSKWLLNQSKTANCFRSPPYRWRMEYKDDAYGASLRAVYEAAELRGYVVVWVIPGLDAFLVRHDLICPHHGIRSPVRLAEAFSHAVGLPLHAPASPAFLHEWTLDFGTWLRSWRAARGSPDRPLRGHGNASGRAGALP